MKRCTFRGESHAHFAVRPRGCRALGLRGARRLAQPCRGVL